MNQKLRVVSFGLGPIGQRAAALAASKTSLDLVGAIDVDPALVGRDLGELLGSDSVDGITVSADAAATLQDARPDAVIHCTSSFLPVVGDQLMAIAESGCNVISSTEELLWPRLQHPDIADRIDQAAQAANVSVLGTGVNPGFVMDCLPAFASSVCYGVESVVCRRYVDATPRRLPFQKKIGASMEVDQFNDLAAQGKLGHIGLRESIALLGAALGFELDTIKQDIQPIVATRALETEYMQIKEGQVAGIHNTGFGDERGKRRIEMDLRMYVGAEDPVDECVFVSEPPMHLRIEGGTQGDFATAAMLVNGLAGVVAAPPGLRTMLEVPLVHLVG